MHKAKFVVDNLRGRGAIFVDELSDVPSEDAKGKTPVVIFSAHGVAKEVKEEALKEVLKFLMQHALWSPKSTLK